MDGESLARSEAQSPKGCEQDVNNKRRKRLKREENAFATEKTEKMKRKDGGEKKKIFSG